MFEETLQHFQDAFRQCWELAQQVPDDKRKTGGVCGEWSTQQIIAHFAGWNREALKRYGDYQRGDTTNDRYDFDAFNAGSVAALSLLNWRETLETWQQTFDDLCAAAKSLTPEQIQSDKRYRLWLESLTEDMHEHRAQIETWLAQVEKEA